VFTNQKGKVFGGFEFEIGFENFSQNLEREWRIAAASEPMLARREFLEP
jgi:hypothetical protein